MNKKFFWYRSLSFFLFVTTTIILYGRSQFRKPEKDLPEITIRYTGEKQSFSTRNSHLEEYPMFALRQEDCLQPYLLPDGPITFANDPTESVQSAQLNKRIEHVVQEIMQKKKKYTYFTLLKKRNFNQKLCCGLIILQFKEYPFVLKLLIETPQTFASLFGKGIEPLSFFYLGGGSNRYLTGMTRIKNNLLVRKRLAEMPQWADLVKTPRKWTWLPKNGKTLEITGKNIGFKKNLSTRLPAIYGVIADTIKTNKEIPISGRQKKKIVMNLCNDLEIFIDPHYDNFIFQPDTSKTGFKIVIIDTEHFPTIVGIKKHKEFRSYSSWYVFLSAKCFDNTFLRTKRKRHEIQGIKNQLACAIQSP